MTRGRFWLRVSVLVAIACGYLGASGLREVGVLPAGWPWWIAAYLACAFVGWLCLAAILTLCGR